MGVQALKPADAVREHTALHGGNASDRALTENKGPIIGLYARMQLASNGLDLGHHAKPESHIS